MPGETKIFKNSSGWYDVDNPGVYYPTRAICRDARSGSKTPNTYHVSTTLTPTVTGVTNLTGLQNRLVDRLTQQQGVSLSDAMSVIMNYGYNASASYGYMREAGADHYEALLVITLDSPSISLAYGLARAAGDDHADALQEALRDD